MKTTPLLKIFLFVPFVQLFCAFSCLAHLAKETIRVVDEAGIPIVGVKVDGQFNNALPPGSGAGGGVPTYTEGLTDTNGLTVLSGICNEPSMGFGLVKNEYYAGGGGYAFTNFSALGEWLPWNPTVVVVMERKGVQVPLYARRMFQQKVPAQGKPCGFDLMIGDWVAPYGKGETSDFLFQLDESRSSVTNRFGSRPFYDYKLTVGFSNDGDGLQLAPALLDGRTLLREAPAEGYINQPLVKQWLNHEDGTKQSGYQKDANYYFRVRTKKDENGKIVSALYGKLIGDFGDYFGSIPTRFQLGFTYYLNPELNVRNLEFNTGSNLFKNLKFEERVFTP